MEMNDGYRLVEVRFPHLCLYARLALLKICPLLVMTSSDIEVRTYSLHVVHCSVLRCIYDNKEELFQCDEIEKNAMICYFVTVSIDYSTIEFETRDNISLFASRNKVLNPK